MTQFFFHISIIQLVVLFVLFAGCFSRQDSSVMCRNKAAGWAIRVSNVGWGQIFLSAQHPDFWSPAIHLFAGNFFPPRSKAVGA